MTNFVIVYLTFGAIVMAALARAAHAVDSNPPEGYEWALVAMVIGLGVVIWPYILFARWGATA